MKYAPITAFLGKPLKLKTGSFYSEVEVLQAAKKFAAQFSNPKEPEAVNDRRFCIAAGFEFEIISFMKHTKVDIDSAARSYRSRFENRKIVDAHLEDAFCAGAKFIQQQNLQQCDVICRWELVAEAIPKGGERCLLVTKSKMIIAGDWYRDGWRTEWSKWEYDSATDRQKMSLLPKDDIIAWMSFPPLPNGI